MQGKRSGQTLKHRLGGLECRPPAVLRNLGFQPVQSRTIIHVSSGFIRGIPVELFGGTVIARTIWPIAEK